MLYNLETNSLVLDTLTALTLVTNSGFVAKLDVSTPVPVFNSAFIWQLDKSNSNFRFPWECSYGFRKILVHFIINI